MTKLKTNYLEAKKAVVGHNHRYSLKITLKCIGKNKNKFCHPKMGKMKMSDVFKLSPLNLLHMNKPHLFISILVLRSGQVTIH